MHFLSECSGLEEKKFSICQWEGAVLPPQRLGAQWPRPFNRSVYPSPALGLWPHPPPTGSLLSRCSTRGAVQGAHRPWAGARPRKTTLHPRRSIPQLARQGTGGAEKGNTGNRSLGPPWSSGIICHLPHSSSSGLSFPGAPWGRRALSWAPYWQDSAKGVLA